MLTTLARALAEVRGNVVAREDVPHTGPPFGEVARILVGPNRSPGPERPAGLVEVAPVVVLGRPGLPVPEPSDLGRWLQRAGGAVRIAAWTPTEAAGATALADAANFTPTFVRIPLGLQALEENRADLVCASAADALPLVQSGRCIAYAVAADERLVAMWDTPTAAEAGLPAFAVSTWSGLYLDATEDATGWNAALQAMLARPAILDHLAAAGHAPPPDPHRSPEAHAQLLTSTRERDAEALRRIGG
jgi:tripartite-type tricarboxylate transporter receptor subunit TctC